MKKIKTLFKAPLETRSGYGEHGRMIFDALTSDPLFDVSVESLNWGNCSHLTEKTPLIEKIKQLVQKREFEQRNNQNHYDLFIHLTIPQEFETLGRFNVGVTAMVETDRISHQWVQACNKMDLIIVPSQHCKEVAENTVIEWSNPNTGEKGHFKIEKPIVVCPEGIDTEIFKSKVHENLINLELESDFNFLHVGQWANGDFGEDRKNISLMLKYFIETFRGRKDVGMVLKTNMSKNSAIDFDFVKTRIKELKVAVGIPESECPAIYLIHANLNQSEMADLYNHPKIKAFLTLTHGEGFGIPILEAAASELPVLATNWSGHLDILSDGKFIPLDYELKEIPNATVWDPVLIKGSRWACVKEDDVKKKMEKIVKSHSKPKEWAKELAEKVREKFDLKVVNEKFISTLKSILLENEVAQVNPEEHLKSYVDTPHCYNVVYTMPRSTGDVFVSTAVIDGLMKELPEDSRLYFATDPKYFDLLKGNKNVYKCIPYNQTMMNMDLLENVFDLALTPDIATQYLFSNWIRRGQGRLLAEEYANHCNSKLGDYFIEKDYSILDSSTLSIHSEGETDKIDNYITFHPGSGQGQWEARNYRDWAEVLVNLKALFPELKVVQVGQEGDLEFKDLVDVDFRGKTTYQQLAAVQEKALLHLGIDSFNMHLAAALNVPLVAIFGCSYAKSTGPWYKEPEKAKFILLESERKSGCVDKACYKNRCAKNPHDGAAPINEIDAREIFQACAKMLIQDSK